MSNANGKGLNNCLCLVSAFSMHCMMVLSDWATNCHNVSLLLVRTPIRCQPMVSGRLVDLFDFHKYVQGQGGYKKVCVCVWVWVCGCVGVWVGGWVCGCCDVLVCVFPTYHVCH